MKTKEEMALSIENIFKNTKNIHGNSKSIDWIKVASYTAAGYLLFDQIGQPPEVMPSDSILDDLKQYITNMLYFAYSFNRPVKVTSEFDKWVELQVDGIDKYFKSQLKPAEKEEKKIPLVNINPYDLSAIKTLHKSFRK